MMIWLCLGVFILGILAYHQVRLNQVFITLITYLCLLWIFQIISLTLFIPSLSILVFSALLLLHLPTRKNYLAKPLFDFFKTIPKLSNREKLYLNSGSTWWDKSLFRGSPAWEQLINNAPATLTDEEQAFIDGPLEELCRRVDHWEMYQQQEIPAKLWLCLKENGFWGLIIPKKYGGLGFSSYAISEILATISTRSIALGNAIASGNSLSPAQLILRLGTEKQKNTLLPRFARGLEIGCTAISNLYSGSDCSSHQDKGILCTKMIEGKKINGFLVTFNKRYVSLSTKATMMSLAFHAFDPEHLLSEKSDLGIHFAIIPTSQTNIKINARHIPLSCYCPTGPIWGKDVFLPMECILGNIQDISHGRKQLIEGFMLNRATALPAYSSGLCKYATAVSSAYARVRRQLNSAIADFPSIQEALAKMAGHLYLSESARKVTAAAVDQGENPATLSAIVKTALSHMYQENATLAMNIQGAKGMMLGPNNTIAKCYLNAPIPASLSGGNFFLRDQVIYKQAVLRCHPYLSQLFNALHNSDPQQGLNHFNQLFLRAIGLTLSHFVKSTVSALTRGRLIHVPDLPTKVPRLYQKVTWASQAFSVISDISLIFYSNRKKFNDVTSSRLGDMLSMLYLASATLKNFYDEKEPTEDTPLVIWSVDFALNCFWEKLDITVRNTPSFAHRLLLKMIFIPCPWKRPLLLPCDKLTSQVANLMTNASPTRERLLKGCFLKDLPNNPAGTLETAFYQILKVQPIEQRIENAIKEGILPNGSLSEILKKSIALTLISEEEAKQVQQAHHTRDQVLAVDNFIGSFTKPLPSKIDTKEESYAY